MMQQAVRAGARQVNIIKNRRGHGKTVCQDSPECPA
jgi:hypothetical protein